MSDYFDKFYEIDFGNNSGVKETLRYQIADTPVSRIWLDRVRWHLALPDCHVFENQWMTTYPSLEKIQNLWRLMKRLVDEANSGEFIQVDYIDMPPEFDPDIDSRPILNYLHFEFHRFEEMLAGKMVGYDPLIQLNVEIHKLEAMISRINDQKTSLLSCGFFLHGNRMNSLTGGDYVVPISDPSLYQYWNYDDDFGDLVLGYHTVGKNIHHCWIDNDQDLIRRGFVRPQTTISNEVVLLFRGNDRYVGGCELTVKQIHQWIRDNDLEQHVDLSRPEHNVAGRPFLGHIVGNYSRDDINNIFEIGRVTGVRLVE